MKQLYGVVFFLATSSPLTGMDPAIIAARLSAIRLLRAFYPRTKVIDFSGKEKVEFDLLDKCTSGDKQACNSLKTLIRNKKTESLLNVGTVEILARDNDAPNIEHMMSGLLEPEKHPCHSLTQASGAANKGYPFAREWIRKGNLKRAIKEKYQSLTDALHLVSSDRQDRQ